MAQASKIITEKRLKWCGRVMKMKEEYIVRRMLDVDIQGKRKRSRGRPKTMVKICMEERFDTGGSERGQRNKQGSMEE